MDIRIHYQTFLNIMSVNSECPICFRNIRSTSKFCKYCGGPLKKCPECQNLNKAEDLFCAECGYDIKDVEVPVSTPSQVAGKTGVFQPIIQRTAGQEDEDSQPKLILWPPLPAQQLSRPAHSRTLLPAQRATYFTEVEPTYEPEKLEYKYKKIKFIGFLEGSLPSSNALAATLEAFGIALILIAFGVGVVAIGLTTFKSETFAVILGIIGSIFVFSAPMFGLYFISSRWLYRAFEIKRPVRLSTVIMNYSLGVLVFALLGLMLAPVFLLGGAIGWTLSIIGGIVTVMGLIVVPLKAYLADLVYVKAAVNQKNKETDNDSEEESDEEESDKEKD